MKTTKAIVGKLDLVGETFYAEGERKASGAHSTEKWRRMRLEEREKEKVWTRTTR